MRDKVLGDADKRGGAGGFVGYVEGQQDGRGVQE